VILKTAVLYTLGNFISFKETNNMRKYLDKLGYFKWTIHNLIAHPLMELLHLVGLGELGGKIHDATLPLSHDDEH